MDELHAEEAPRVEEQLRLAGRARSLRPGSEPPYLAHLRIRTAAGIERDLLFGTAAAPSSSPPLLDWRTAPLAEVLHGCSEGDDYELDLGDRAITGTLLRRARVAFDRGELVEVWTDDAVWTRRGGEGWIARPAPSWPALPAAPLASQARPAAIRALELDAEQQALVELPPGRPLLVLGEAGCGKTTVALRRLAHLAAGAGEGFRAAVVVPTEGLRLLAEAMRDDLGVAAEVWELDRFAAVQARRAFGDLPPRESVGASPAVARLKRHPALREALLPLARLAPPPRDEDRPRRPSRALARVEDLHALFGDRAWMERVLLAAGGELARHCLDEVLDHTRLQYSVPSDEELADVLPEARRTSDGRPIDEGTPLEDADTVDVEDYAVLFELDRLRAGAAGRPPAPLPRYDCLVIDEAQELAPLELALLGRCLRPGGTLIVAGDADQQLDPTTAFRGWPAAMAELGALDHADHARGVLGLSYRCPPGVTRFARTLRAGAGRGAVPAAPGQELPPYSRLPSELHVAEWLATTLRTLRAVEPVSSVGVLCRSPDRANRLARALGFGADVRRSLDPRAAPPSAVLVASVDEVRGLELDRVVIPDADRATYPDTPEARRALYVAVTRARHQVILAGPGPASHLLP
jgi:hypothetical protein